MPQAGRVIHTFDPIWDEKSRALILGTMPSPVSRDENFYYCHPRNRFWRVLAAVFGEFVPEKIDDKKRLLLNSGVALWDVLASCEIEGAADASIKNPVPNDIAGLVSKSGIKRVLLNGRTAGALYDQHCAHAVSLPASCLPSTSPANAAWSLERLTEEWRRGLSE